MSNLANNAKNYPLKVSDEQAHWMRFSNLNYAAEDNILSNTITSGGYGYRKVHFTEEVEQNKTLFGFGKDKVFFDNEWKIRETEDLSKLATKTSGPVVLRRLSHLYPGNSDLRPKFFPEKDLNEPLRKVEDLTIVPHFLHEMGLFPVSQFKSLFFTQDFQPSGMYHAVVNYNGRWETDVVDDFIPVYEKTGKPIWGMDLEQPWQLILAKFLAKRYYCLAKEYKYDMATRGGYTGINTAAPFEFVGFFTNNIWKFFNLNVDHKTFLNKNVGIVHKAHFILKSKNSSHVRDSGLIQNEACYELVNLVEEGVARSASGIKNSTTAGSKVGSKKVNYIATIRSSNKTHWAGKKSVLDSDFKNIHKGATKTYKEQSKLTKEHTFNDERNENFGLDRYFTIDGQELKNLFSCCYVSSRRVGSDFVSGYFKFKYPAQRTNACYLEFEIPKETFFDFSISQNRKNRTPIKSGSRIEHEQHQREHGGVGSSNERFLYTKYMLVKDNSKSKPTPSQVEYEKEYNKLNYETYEIEFLKGYNAGEGHFLNAVEGRFILRLKSEMMIDKDAEYVINYASTSEINFKEIFPSKEEETKIMKDALASTIDKVPRTNLINGIETQVIAYGNTFDYVGYGYIGAKLKKSSKAQILIDVDPKALKEDGYRLKHLYKKETEPFAIVVSPGEATAVVLKKINDNAVLNWPPKGIAIFQKPFKPMQ